MRFETWLARRPTPELWTLRNRYTHDLALGDWPAETREALQAWISICDRAIAAAREDAP